ncbi:MAG: DUF2383 domain-containing protein [Methylobacter sp.]|nr:DUF2383 domain-containing protein [Methylobacter sp.]
MLRTEKQATLNNIINSTLKSIEHYRWAADSLNDEQIGNLLYESALEREMIVDKLAPQMYKLGDLPSSPDPEKLAVEEIFTKLKATFSHNEKDVLLTRLNEFDSLVLQEIRYAFNLDFEEETIEILQALKELVVNTSRKLAG